MKKPDERQLTLFQGDFLASRLALPGNSEATKMTVSSGLRCLELYRNSSLVGCLVRMLLESSIWRSTKCFLTWRISDMRLKHLLFQLVPSTPDTDEIGSLLWGTPNTMDYLPQRSEESLIKQATTSRKGRTRPANLREQVNPDTVRLWLTATGPERSGINKNTGRGAGLSHAVKMWPTPRASCSKPASAPTKRGLQDLQTAVFYATPQARDFRTGQVSRWENPKRSRNLNDQLGGQLNPTWVEWLMGFPINYTEVA